MIIVYKDCVMNILFKVSSVTQFQGQFVFPVMNVYWQYGQHAQVELVRHIQMIKSLCIVNASWWETKAVHTPRCFKILFPKEVSLFCLSFSCRHSKYGSSDVVVDVTGQFGSHLSCASRTTMHNNTLCSHYTIVTSERAPSLLPFIGTYPDSCAELPVLLLFILSVGVSCKKKSRLQQQKYIVRKGSWKLLHYNTGFVYLLCFQYKV